MQRLPREAELAGAASPRNWLESILCRRVRCRIGGLVRPLSWREHHGPMQHVHHTVRGVNKLPRPLTPMQRLVHTADFLDSRKDITLADIS